MLGIDTIELLFVGATVGVGLHNSATWGKHILVGAGGVAGARPTTLLFEKSHCSIAFRSEHIDSSLLLENETLALDSAESVTIP